MAVIRHPHIGYTRRYTRHPLTWERTDLGRPVIKLALLLLALLLVGIGATVLFVVLASNGPGTTGITNGGLGGELPLNLFALAFSAMYFWPLNALAIFAVGLPILWIAKLIAE